MMPQEKFPNGKSAFFYLGREATAALAKAAEEKQRAIDLQRQEVEAMKHMRESVDE